jgi:aminoglycoside phosphotransferase (APT) family kinase protein
MAARMHVDEVDIDPGLVRRLLAAQFPQWADLSLRPVVSAGTDNALYRLGEDMVVRLPRIPSTSRHLTDEDRWLAQLAPHLPLQVPASRGIGNPTEGYPGIWSVQRWISGRDAVAAVISDPAQAAIDLGRFVSALQGIHPTDGPAPRQRGKPLASRDVATRAAIEVLRDLNGDAASISNLDLDAALTAWTSAVQVPDWGRPPVWFHGDLLPGNLVVSEGRLSAVIDFGCMGVGDPACDAMVAWTFLAASERETFRLAADVDDATWARGRGWALSVGLIALPYYRFSNPTFAHVARRAVDEAIADR